MTRGILETWTLEWIFAFASYSCKTILTNIFRNSNQPPPLSINANKLNEQLPTFSIHLTSVSRSNHQNSWNFLLPIQSNYTSVLK